MTFGEGINRIRDIPTDEIARALCVPRPTVARRIERRVREQIATIGVFASGLKIGQVREVAKIAFDWPRMLHARTG